MYFFLSMQKSGLFSLCSFINSRSLCLDKRLFCCKFYCMTKCVVVRGGGDLATGVVHALKESGISVVILESSKPSAIRRKVSFCEAVYQGCQTVENVTAVLCQNAKEACGKIKSPEVPLLIDEKAAFLSEAKTYDVEVVCIIDAIIAKKNLGTNKKMAPIVIALGPGFIAGEDDGCDCDAVIETMRGHNLGRIITHGRATANTGIPGVIGGYGKERVIHSPAEGRMKLVRDIGDVVNQGEVLAYVASNGKKTEVCASLSGVLRGIIRNGFEVFKGMKIADIDPRISEQENCFTISDKSRSLGNATLHAVLAMLNKKGICLW